ncbi:ABC transporter permease [Armatimonas sp.]|uniref:ABC transporter permease n=1 Tax=Armatimonas sp. TaxID=1872638 RepID=UPI00375321B5
MKLIACVLGGLLLLAAVILAAKASPIAVAAALLRGAFGSKDSVANTLIQTTPLLLTGLGVGLTFKGKLFNIGAEGQFLLGAVFAIWAGTQKLPPPVLLPLALLAGALGGALWAGLAAALKLWRGVQEVLSTLLLNFVAIQLVAWMVRGPLQEAVKQYPQSDKLAISSRLAFLWPGTQLHQGFLIALFLAVVVWAYLSKTASGFALRAVGAGAEAAEAAGISVAKTTWGTFLLSGALSGLAGAIQICGVTYFLADPYSKGYGYTAIAVALLANLSPLWTVLTALFFGALTAGATEVQSAGVSSVVIQVLQAVTLLTVLTYGWLKERGK